ncbi:PIN domain-containing protein [Cellulomonas triticagri]|uniref:PIN domain-containing protein n=1 Tax=Cellulomonas triticagri TaxID=2483352 RepID=A0A3M2JB95_9CELL|nr:PIN domain-containing protein [Cellulomonas triticagri]RMI09070.1 PIN domain-containing protein [Cellulomonas triticagri]
MAFVVVLDACVLVPHPLVDTLLRAADAGLYEPRWSAQILDEVERALVRARGLEPGRAAGRVRAMRRAFPHAEVDGHDDLVPAMRNDPKDRHVLAAAVRTGAAAVITANVKDFPTAALAPHAIEALHPDEFLLDLLDLDEPAVLRVLADQARAYANPPVTLPTLRGHLAAGLRPRRGTPRDRRARADVTHETAAPGPSVPTVAPCGEHSGGMQQNEASAQVDVVEQARRRAADVRRNVEQVLALVEEEGGPFDFVSVAAAAHCSVTYLRQHREFATRIRDLQATVPGPPAAEPARSDAVLDRRLARVERQMATLRATVSRLEDENSVLRFRMAEAARVRRPALGGRGA